jgi:hypothetical protein
MGAALPVIGLAISGIGTVAGIAGQAGSGGGTIYTADSKAKYQADLEALKLAEYNAKQRESLIAQERLAAQDFAKFQHEQMLMQLNSETELATLGLQQQWEAINYARNIDKQVGQMEKFMSNASLESARQGVETQYEQTKRQLGLDQFDRQSQLGFKDRGRDLQGAGLSAQEAGLALEENKLGTKKAQLDQQGAEARQQIGNQELDLGLKEQEFAQGQFQAEQGLQSQESQASTSKNLALAQADEAKRQALNEMLRVFSGNERDFAKYQAMLTANGVNLGGNVQFDQNMNQEIQGQMQGIQNQASMSKTSAGIQQGYTQSQIGQQRSGLAAQANLANQGFSQARQQFGQARQNIDVNQALANQQLSQAQRGIDLSKSGLLLDRHRLDLDREYDVFSMSILPDLRMQQALEQAKTQKVQSLFGINSQQVGEDFARTTQDTVEDRQYELDRTGYEEGLKAVPKNYDYQRKAADSSYLSALGSSSTQAEAALAMLAANQHGLLSGLGQGLANGTQTGYRPSSNTAAGIANALGSIGGFMGQLQGYLGARNMNSSTGGSSQFMGMDSGHSWK